MSRPHRWLMAAMIVVAVAFLFLTGCAQAPQGSPVGAVSGAPATTPAEPSHPAICGPRGELLAALAEDYGEAPVWMGVTADGLIAELFLGPHTWTWMVTAPSGVSCLVDAGTEWQAMTPEPRVKGEAL